MIAQLTLYLLLLALSKALREHPATPGAGVRTRPPQSTFGEPISLDHRRWFPVRFSKD
ncbi:hypothetical protein [Haladaptatus sp. DFWS20]|uniref:hypothetical protein n=1 Tax=Haladaptatus sp. DFWS20 TaxID=3403467 RepID=UPI003EB6BEE0